jgi:hypothetical protein
MYHPPVNCVPMAKSCSQNRPTGAYEAMELAEDPGFTLTVYPAVPGSPSDESLRLLASWAETGRIQDLAAATQPQDVRRP